MEHQYLLMVNFKNGITKKIPMNYQTGANIVDTINKRKMVSSPQQNNIEHVNSWVAIDIAGERHFHFDAQEIVFVHLYPMTETEIKIEVDSNNNFKG